MPKNRASAGRPAPTAESAPGSWDDRLVAGTIEHYLDPELYDHEYARRRADLNYYRALCSYRRSQLDGAKGPGRGGKANGAPRSPRALRALRVLRILELGCGSGRLLLPLLRDGHEVTGLDLSQPMLARCAARIERLPEAARARATLVRGDFRRFDLGRRFDVVLTPFNAMMHLYTRDDVERFLARVREHLAPKGRFVFDVSMPVAEELARKPERAYFTPRFKYPGVGIVRYSERFDYEPLRQILFVAMRFEPKDGQPFMTPLAHRQFYPQELEALLHYNGFDVLSIDGDFEGPATNQSRTLIYTCKTK